MGRGIDSLLVVSASRGRQADPFVDTLVRAKVNVQHLASLEDALAILRLPLIEVQCVVIDADATGGAQTVDSVAGAVERVREEAPAVAPIVVASRPSSRLVATLFRAGAADVIDLATIDESAVLDALARASGDHATRVARSTLVSDLRRLIDDFLRVLVRLERRNLELETTLHPELHPEEDEQAAAQVPPQVLVVDDEAPVVDLLMEALLRVGVEVHGCYTGEEAPELYRRLHDAHRPIDLALVDKNLPGISGIEAIGKLRALNPSLPCLVMTGYPSGESAVKAADLGVVGYVLKPFDDVRELAARVKGLASRYAAERRERRVLARIKLKHAQFLEHYRQLVTDLDRLG